MEEHCQIVSLKLSQAKSTRITAPRLRVSFALVSECIGVLNNYNCIYCRIYSTSWAVRVAQPISDLHRKKANAYIYALS